MQEWINTKQELAEVRIELEETQEALRRNRNQLESYKMFEKEIELKNIQLDWYLKKCVEHDNMSIWQIIIKKLKWN